MTRLKVNNTYNIRSYLGIEYIALNQPNFPIERKLNIIIAPIITYHR